MLWLSCIHPSNYKRSEINIVSLAQLAQGNQQLGLAAVLSANPSLDWSLALKQTIELSLRWTRGTTPRLVRGHPGLFAHFAYICCLSPPSWHPGAVGIDGSTVSIDHLSTELRPGPCPKRLQPVELLPAEEPPFLIKPLGGHPTFTVPSRGIGC